MTQAGWWALGGMVVCTLLGIGVGYICGAGEYLTHVCPNTMVVEVRVPCGGGGD